MSKNVIESGYFGFAKQCKKEYADTHLAALKYFCEFHNKDNKVTPIYQNHISHRDFEWSIGKYSGFYEGKHDTWATGNIVIEFVGSVQKYLLDKYKIPFPKRSEKFCMEYQEDSYLKIHNFLQKCFDGDLGKINLGYGAIENHVAGKHSLFGYFRRPLKRIKNNAGYWENTGEVLDRNLFLYRGMELRKIAMNCFKNKQGELQIVSNEEYGNCWASINLLIDAKVFGTALKAEIHFINDTNVDDMTIFEKEEN